MKPATQRDEGLRRVSTLTRWMVAGSVAVAGVFTAAAARALPGHAKASSTTTVDDGSASGGSVDSGAAGGTVTPPAAGPSVSPTSPSAGSSSSSSASSGSATLSPPPSRILGGRGRGRVSSGGS